MMPQKWCEGSYTPLSCRTKRPALPLLEGSLFSFGLKNSKLEKPMKRQAFNLATCRSAIYSKHSYFFSGVGGGGSSFKPF